MLAIQRVGAHALQRIPHHVLVLFSLLEVPSWNMRTQLIGAVQSVSHQVRCPRDRNPIVSRGLADAASSPLDKLSLIMAATL